MKNSQKKEKGFFQTHMTEQEFKTRLEAIKHRYSIMYAFAMKDKGFDELDLLTPEEFAEDLTVMRDYVQYSAHK